MLKRMATVILGAVVSVGAVAYLTVSASAQKPDDKKMCGTECCCCQQDAKAPKAEGGCCAKRKM